MKQIILTNFFLNRPFITRRLTKPQIIINEVSPNLFTNLKDSTKNFIQAVISKDVEYITNVCSPSFGEKLTQQINTTKDINYKQTYVLQCMNLEDVVKFQICPYVVFGQDIKKRYKKQNLYQQNWQVTLNKFFYNPVNIGIMEKINLYQKKHIYGFNCIYQPRWVINTSQDQSTYRQHQFMVSFETDSQNIDFWVTDCQGIQLVQSKNSRFKRQ